MRKKSYIVQQIIFTSCLVFQLLNLELYAQNNERLKIDPLLLISLKETWNINKQMPSGLFPGWNIEKTPVLFYKPEEQDLLINFPHKPKNFADYTGFSPLGNTPIYIRNTDTLFKIDDQNTNTQIDGLGVLVVADPASRMRNQLRGTIESQSKDFILGEWMAKWGFIQSPYDEIYMILHEAFHVHQNEMAPDKAADEGIVAKYPLYDPENNSLYSIEGLILKDALLAPDANTKLEKAKEFISVRNYRQSRLNKEVVEYENLNEYSEGLAKYIEYKFMSLGESAKPIDEMKYHAGFYGYKHILSEDFKVKISRLPMISGITGNQFGDKFSSGPMRFRLYELGAAQALLLDEFQPQWKQKIFNKDIYLTNLLTNALNLSEAEKQTYLKQAQALYGYEKIYRDKLQFESDGKKSVQKKLETILKTDKNLITIDYSNLTPDLAIQYTPFGVTQVGDDSAIYDMVPIKIRFAKGFILSVNNVNPVWLDKKKKTATFAVSTDLSKFVGEITGKIETDEFTIKAVKIFLTEKSRKNFYIKLSQ